MGTTDTRSASPERNHDSHCCPSRLDVEYPPGLFSIFCRREENLKRQAETGNMTCNDMEKSLSPDRYARRATPGHGRCRALLDPTPRAPNIIATPASHLGMCTKFEYIKSCGVDQSENSVCQRNRFGPLWLDPFRFIPPQELHINALSDFRIPPKACAVTYLHRPYEIRLQ